jgi:hypothetical protein
MLQLASGDIISAFTRQVINGPLIQNARLLDGAQTQANAVIQQVQAAYTAAYQCRTRLCQTAAKSMLNSKHFFATSSRLLRSTGPELIKSRQYYTSALERGGWLAPRPGRFTPGKYPVPIAKEAGWASGSVWTCAKNLAPTGIRSPDRPARSQSLY